MAGLTNFESEVQQLNAELLNLKSRLEAILSTTKKLDSEFNEGAGGAQNLNNKLKDVDRTTDQLTASEKELIRIQKASEKITKETALAQAQLTEKRKKYREEAQRSLGIQKKSNGLFRSMKSAILSAGAAMLGISAAIGLFVKGIKGAVKTVISFDKEIANLQGILGITDRAAMRPLIQSAKELGATTAKSASEVIKLQQAYARLGFTQDEIIKLTKGTIAGSIALNAELDATAELTGAMVNSFDNLESMDAGHILDVITLSTQKSATNFEFLATALPIVAGAANGAGVAFESLVDQLGQAADRGIDASTAATSLRNIYLELSKKGLTLEEALGKINSSQDKLSKANELFGKRAAVTALALASNAKEASKFNQALETVGGTAQRVADVQLDTLQGDITLLKSAWEGLILGVESGEGIFAKMGRGIIQGLTSMITAVIEFRNKFVVAFNDLIRSSATFRTIIKSLGVVSQSTFKAIFEFILLTIDPIILLGEAMEDIVTGNFKDLRGTFKEGFNDIKNRAVGLFDIFKEGGQSIASAFRGDNIDDMLIGVSEVSTEMISATAKVNAFNTELEETAKTEKEIEASRKKDFDSEKKREQERKNRIKQSADQIDFLAEQEIKKNKEKLLRKEIDEETFAMNMLEIQATYLTLQKQNKELTDEEILAIDQKLLDAQLAMSDMRIAKAQEESEKTLEIKQREQETLFDIGNALFDFSQSLFERELANLEAQEEYKLSLVEGNEKEEEKIRETYAKKRAEVKRKQAIADKLQALFNAGINVAQGITAALALGLPGIFLAALIGILGAIQIASIAAKPIPKFAKGVKGFEGGPAIVGEEGRELMITPGGGVQWSPDHATQMLLPRGTDIIPHRESEQIIQGGVMPEKYDAMISELRETRKAILNRPVNEISLTDGGLRKSHKHNRSRIIWEETYMRN